MIIKTQKASHVIDDLDLPFNNDCTIFIHDIDDKYIQTFVENKFYEHIKTYKEDIDFINMDKLLNRLMQYHMIDSLCSAYLIFKSGVDGDII